jgi:hypothetical protein
VNARKFLDHCVCGLDELHHDLMGSSWIVRWSGVIGLLRVVGFALQKLDGQNCTALNRAQEEWWQGLRRSQPHPSIFWGFIHDDRNALLHGAEIRAGQSAMVPLVGVSATARAAGQEPPKVQAARPQPIATYTYHMTKGPHAGRDPRELVEEAIQWWHLEIERIERDAARYVQI